MKREMIRKKKKNNTHIQDPTILARAGQASSRSAPTAPLSSKAPPLMLLLLRLLPPPDAWPLLLLSTPPLSPPPLCLTSTGTSPAAAAGHTHACNTHKDVSGMGRQDGEAIRTLPIYLIVIKAFQGQKPCMDKYSLYEKGRPAEYTVTILGYTILKTVLVSCACMAVS